jgi:hypothetical protein
VADISVHDAVEEGEEHDGEVTGVELAITRHTVRVDDALVAARELGAGDERGRGGTALGGDGVAVQGGLGAGSLASEVECVSEVIREFFLTAASTGMVSTPLLLP